MTAYLTKATVAQYELKAAIAAARALLPEGIRMRQGMFAKHQPSQSAAWDSAHDWYYGTEEADEETLLVLLHLKLLTAALANLATVTQPVPTGEPDLQLAKTRRTA